MRCATLLSSTVRLRLARSGVHSESMHLDVGCLEVRSVEPSGTLGWRESRASGGLNRTGDTRVLVVNPSHLMAASQ
eukprot:4405371-Prymnesium_polylepis.1